MISWYYISTPPCNFKHGAWYSTGVSQAGSDKKETMWWDGDRFLWNHSWTCDTIMVPWCWKNTEKRFLGELQRFKKGSWCYFVAQCCQNSCQLAFWQCMQQFWGRFWVLHLLGLNLFCHDEVEKHRMNKTRVGERIKLTTYCGGMWISGRFGWQTRSLSKACRCIPAPGGVASAGSAAHFSTRTEFRNSARFRRLCTLPGGSLREKVFEEFCSFVQHTT